MRRAVRELTAPNALFSQLMEAEEELRDKQVVAHMSDEVRLGVANTPPPLPPPPSESRAPRHTLAAGGYTGALGTSLLLGRGGCRG
jgi:hypothetical protein